MESARTGRGLRRAGRIVVAIVAVIGLALLAVVFWAHIEMQGDRDAALEAWTNDDISIESTDHSIVMTPVAGASSTGLVFIPGAKVDPYAYMFKLSGLVEQGVTVVITKPTLNLAFFDTRPLATFTADAPLVDEWFVGGHSLGGVRSCMLAADSDLEPGEVEVVGIVLFGSYCATDLSQSGLTAISIGGGTDGLSTPEKIAGAASLLPADAVFIELPGFNHASFGDYGEQSGDGATTLSSREARELLTAALLPLVGRSG